MKTSQLNRRVSLGLAIPAFALMSTALAQEDEIVGTWNCSMSAEQEGMTMSMEFERIFEADGTTEIDGKMSISAPQASLEASMLIVANGTWSAESMVLTEKMTDGTVKSASETPSQLEQMFVAQMQAEFSENAQEEQTTITALTETTMELESGGMPLKCERAA